MGKATARTTKTTATCTQGWCTLWQGQRGTVRGPGGTNRTKCRTWVASARSASIAESGGFSPTTIGS